MYILSVLDMNVLQLMYMYLYVMKSWFSKCHQHLTLYLFHSFCAFRANKTYILHLKPMDSFGTWRKWKLIYIFLFRPAEFYRVVWTINALLIVRSEMLPFSGNNQNRIFSESPRTLCWVMYIMIICHWAILHYSYVIPNNCRKVWWCFLMISCTFWRSRKILLNSPKLPCGFKSGMKHFR